MKVLFAVNDEKDAESITRMYQKEYKEIISSKTVYYYNAIIKELQKDKTYDRIVISEDLEMFSSDNYQAIDKFIFEKMDTISDEATNLDGSDIPIILLCMDRRTKNDPLLVKLFGLGIYNVLIGQDRSVQKVVDLIYKPRNKKEAKVYYKVEAEKVTYTADTSDNGVSETEMQNILNHYKRIGANPKKCVQSFDSITAQYSPDQVKLIVQTLPKSVRNILEDNSSSYRKLMGIKKKNAADISTDQKDYVEKEIDVGSKLTQPVIIPTAVASKKISKNAADLKNKDVIEQRKAREKAEAEAEAKRKARERAAEAKRKEEERIAKEKAEAEARRREEERIAKEKAAAEARRREEERIAKEKAAAEAKRKEEERKAKEKAAAEAKKKAESKKKVESQTETTTVKRGRGRPRKNPIVETVLEDVPVKKKRGRPRKNPVEAEEIIEEVKPVVKADEENVVKNKNKKSKKAVEEDINDVLLDFDDFEDDVVEDVKNNQSYVEDDEDILPGFDDYDEDEIENSSDDDDEFDYDFDDLDLDDDKKSKDDEDVLDDFDEEEDDDTLPGFEDDDEEDLSDLDDDDEFDYDDLDDDYDDYEDEEDDTLPGFDDDEEEEKEDSSDFDDDDEFDYDDLDDDYDDYEDEEDDTLPGFEEDDEEEKEDLSDLDDDEFDFDDLDDDYDDYEDEEDDTLPGFDDDDDDTLPGFDDEEESSDIDADEEDDDFDYNFDDEEDDETLPGFDDDSEEDTDVENNASEDIEEDDDELLPGFEEDSYDDEDGEIIDFDAEEEESKQHDGSFKGISNKNYRYDNDLASSIKDLKETEESTSSYNMDTDSLISSGQKIVSFVGTSKNGTSFIVNNLAELYSNRGIKTAILDLTKNKNAYYIYTNNDDELREKAHNCLDKLKNGIADGVPVNKNLDVFTSLPSEDDSLDEVPSVIHTLLENYTIVLLDCDFETDVRYFKASQEVYLVQTMDVLTIQPLTAFLRELKLKNILEPSKLRIVINKNIKVGSLNEKILIGGMSVYNDPGMTYMTDLFNRDTIKYVTVPFEDQVYVKYLEGLVNCKISSKGYSKSFLASLNKLGDMVYPTINGKKAKNYNNYSNQNTFSNDTNDILDKMKKKY